MEAVRGVTGKPEIVPRALTGQDYSTAIVPIATVSLTETIKGT